MKNVIIIISILFLSNDLLSQINVRANLLPNGNFQYVNKQTNKISNSVEWNEVESFEGGFAKVYKDYYWNFVNADGQSLSNEKYDLVRNFTNHLAAVKLNNKWGYINEEGKTIIECEYDIAFDFKENVTGAFKKNKWFLIKKDGSIVKELDVAIFYGFKNKEASIIKNGRKGRIDIQGNIIYLEPPSLATKITDAKNSNFSARPQSAPCPPNIGFDLGNFTNWNCFVGTTFASGSTNVISVTPSAPTATRHQIYSAGPTIDPYGLFSTTPPDGSGYALKLGNNINGSKAERVTYQIVVPAGVTDASITYRYAVVFEDPGHFSYQQPRFSAKLLDVATNTYLPCASYEYVSNNSIPGFFNSPLDDSVKCKSWASVFINLSAYAGKTLRLEFTTADCTRGAHWGYAYVDVGDCNIAADVQYQCNTNTATGSAPPGFQFYNWWNNDYTAILATGQNPTISPLPASNSSLHVEIIPFNGFGCRDTLDVQITNSFATADAGLDKNFCEGDAVTIGAVPVTGNVYSWSPATYLSNAAISNPTASPPVSTTYYLTVTNPANTCSKTDTVNIVVNPKPTPDFVAPASQCISDNNF